MSAPSLDLARPRQRARRKPPAVPSRAVLRRLASPLVLLALWQLASSTGLLPERLLAAPDKIASAGLDLLRDGTLASAIGVSLRRAATGFLIGAVIGVGLALVAGLSRIGENAVDPPMQMLRAAAVRPDPAVHPLVRDR
ncbi:ABC transporter permease [Actinomadura sp. HBU206391]|uniref:ABC transporter permease n=1 Tax=Actinomadura sp. HBU206391 TaxID=2731692 RepID=UPI0021C9E448|nr:hypothetical protein [Actinomadura sp. HBU206391]